MEGIAPAAGGRRDPRLQAGDIRTPEFEGGRPERAGADRSGLSENAEAAAVLGGYSRQSRIRSPRRLHDLQAQPPASIYGGFRCPRCAPFLPAPGTGHPRAAGAWDVERQTVE